MDAVSAPRRQSGPRVSLVHERFTEYAGSERVVEQLAVAWPQAPIYAPIVLDDALPPALTGRVHGSALTSLVPASGWYAHTLPLLPMAMRRLPVADTDVVITSHHAFATQVVHATHAPVVAYVHTPARWIWDPTTRAGEAGGGAGALAMRGFAAAYRRADRAAAAKLRLAIANSNAVAERIRRYWDIDATVIHPPVDTDFYTPEPRTSTEDFILLAGRLVPYKRPEIAVAAARKAGLRLIVAGDGRSRAACEKVAGPETTFLGRVSDTTLRSLFRRCRFLVLPGEEDFGIVPVEGQACGSPVLATGAGGALDTVVPGESGDLVDVDATLGTDELVDRWAQAMSSFRWGQFEPRVVRASAERFAMDRFRSAMIDAVTAALGT